MVRKPFLLSVALWAGLAGPMAQAREDLVPGSRYTSGRGAALGDALIPLADDGASGLFYNPAGIGKARRTTLEPLNFQIQANQDYLSMFDRNFYKVMSLPSYAPSLGARPEYMPGVGAAVFPNFSTRGIAFGVLMQSHFSANSANGSIRYRSRYQFIPTIGGALRLASGVVRLGYSLQWVHQAVGDITVPENTEPLGYNQQIKEGSGISHNLGLAVTLPVSYLPSFNLVARNVMNTRFTSRSIIPLARNSTGSPETEPMTVDAAVSIHPKTGRGGTINMVLEYRDITSRSPMPFLGKLATGLEFSFRELFFLRAGWGSGYPAAGLGLRRPTAEFSLSWFSEEVGNGFLQERDTRFMLHYQIRAF